VDGGTGGGVGEPAEARSGSFRGAMVTEPVPRLLVVEDTGLVRDVLWEILEHAGFALDSAQTASEAVENGTKW
jgi:hypothetical protein